MPDNLRLIGKSLAAFMLLSAAACWGQTEPLQGPEIRPWPFDKPVTTIGFGSCLRENRPAPIFQTIAAEPPDVYLFLGDNIYGDTEDPAVFRRKYQRLMDKPGFRDLRDRSTVLAIWDDHDYGENDAGIEFPAKELARQHFLSFWGEPKDSPRWTTDGNYGAHIFGPEGQRVQVILLDTRWSRSPLVRLPERAEFGPYGRNDDPKTRLLGEAQWAWLEEQLKVPAQVRIIATSIQLLADEHNFEKWGNFPHEKARLLKLLETSSGVPIVVSGDRHSGEISRFDLPNGRRLYDITSSALNQGSGIPSAEPNALRRGARIAEPHTGVIEIDWETGQVRMQLRRESGSVLVESSDRLRTMAGRENAAP